MRNKVRALMPFLISSYFIVFPLYLITNLKLMEVFFLLTILVILLSIVNKKISKDIFAYIILYIIGLIFYLYLGSLKNDFDTTVFKQSIYHLKPLVFFLLGYFLISQNDFNKTVTFIFYLSLLGSLIFYFDPAYIVNASLSYLGKTESGYFLGFGDIIRNVSFFLSPLEFGGMCLFFLYHFSLSDRELNYPIKATLTLLMLCSTLSRSFILGAILLFIFGYIIKLKKRDIVKAAVLCIVFLIVIIFLTLNNTELLERIFVTDGSASVHHENLLDSFEFISINPFGVGVGGAGWPGYGLNLKYYHYSEGSLISSIIEFGIIPVLFWIISISVFIYLKSLRLFVFWVCYLFTCLLVPVGYSTFINLLFFCQLGVICSENYLPKIRRILDTQNLNNSKRMSTNTFRI